MADSYQSPILEAHAYDDRGYLQATACVGLDPGSPLNTDPAWWCLLHAALTRHMGEHTIDPARVVWWVNPNPDRPWLNDHPWPPQPVTLPITT